MAKLPSLRMLSLAMCENIDDAAIHEIVQICPRVRHLNLSKCPRITDGALQAIARAYGSTLYYLHVGHCVRITDLGVKAIRSNCPGLSFFDAANCSRLTSNALLHLATLPRLRRIGVVKCTGIDDTAVIALAVAQPNPPFERLHFSYCTQLTANAVKRLVNDCPHLVHLSLTGVSDFMHSSFRSLSKKPSAELTDHQKQMFCVFSGNGIAKLRHCLNYSDPTLSDTDVSDETVHAPPQRHLLNINALENLHIADPFARRNEQIHQAHQAHQNRPHQQNQQDQHNYQDQYNQDQQSQQAQRIHLAQLAQQAQLPQLALQTLHEQHTQPAEGNPIAGNRSQLLENSNVLRYLYNFETAASYPPRTGTLHNALTNPRVLDIDAGPSLAFIREHIPDGYDEQHGPFESTDLDSITANHIFLDSNSNSNSNQPQTVPLHGANTANAGFQPTTSEHGPENSYHLDAVDQAVPVVLGTPVIPNRTRPRAAAVTSERNRSNATSTSNGHVNEEHVPADSLAPIYDLINRYNIRQQASAVYADRSSDSDAESETIGITPHHNLNPALPSELNELNELNEFTEFTDLTEPTGFNEVIEPSLAIQERLQAIVSNRAVQQANVEEIASLTEAMAVLHNFATRRSEYLHSTHHEPHTNEADQYIEEQDAAVQTLVRMVENLTTLTQGFLDRLGESE